MKLYTKEANFFNLECEDKASSRLTFVRTYAFIQQSFELKWKTTNVILYVLAVAALVLLINCERFYFIYLSGCISMRVVAIVWCLAVYFENVLGSAEMLK
jgi:hypothetical protein